MEAGQEMCDTIAVFDPKTSQRSFFAKNSDRDPKELQFIQLTDQTSNNFEKPYYENTKYLEKSYPYLEKIRSNYPSHYRAIISRPAWIWGAEMGVNEFGVSIGNEAVFSKIKVANQGLLGMDLLRLALHNAATADAALELIITLIEQQGGDGGYHHSLKYHNSFLIKDFKTGYILETSGKHWAYRRISETTAISNSYSLTTDYEISDLPLENKNFKTTYENKIMSWLAQGDYRRHYATSFLHKRQPNLATIKELLRSHHNSTRPTFDMKSICLHAGNLYHSETTASLIVDYLYDKLIVWFTNSPHPCVSLYKPLIFTEKSKLPYDLTDPNYAIINSLNLQKTSNKLAHHYSFFVKHLKPLRDEIEAKFSRLIYDNIEQKSLSQLAADCNQCFKLSQEYEETVEKLLKRKNKYAC